MLLVGLGLLVFLASGCGKGDGKPVAHVRAATNPKLDAIRESNCPATLAELNDWYAVPTSGDKSAGLYQRAFDELAPDEATSPSFLIKNQKTLELLHQAASRARCRYPSDLTKGSAAELPHLAKIKKCAQLLAQAANSHANSGQMELAAQSILDGLCLARSLADEPVLISQLVRIAAEGLIETGLETVLNRRAFSEEQLARLQAAFRDAESGAPLSKSLTGERCMGIALFEMPPEEFAQLAMMTVDIAAEGSKAATSPDFAAYQKSRSFAGDYDFFLDRMAEAIDASHLSFPECLDAFGQWGDQVKEARTRGYVISGLLLTPLRSAQEKVAESTGRLRVTQTALAVERWRLANAHAMPASLDQLMPRLLDAVPADPFNGRPLRYTKTSPKGYVVYSLGKDRTDQGGKSRTAGTAPDAGSDLTFAVRR